MSQTHYRVIIIGSGPAGYTAAIYAARAGLSPLVIAGYASGGQLMTTTDVENYPGFPEGIDGPELMKYFRAQAARFDSLIIDKDVTQVDFSERPFKIQAGNDAYTADAVIVSTGAQAKTLGMKGEKEYWGRGVSTCATCDGAFFKNKVVAVVGGGDTAAEEALYLSRIASKVFLVHRREAFRASHIMVERMRTNPNIEFFLNYVVDEIKGNENGVTSMALKSTQDESERDVPVSAVFEAIGHAPTTELFKGQLEMHENGYLKVVPGTTETNVPGVFAAGDVQDHVYRQAVTAAGTGCMAAIALERFLNE